jgi:fido (protein-threonine AMPylation protein)
MSPGDTHPPDCPEFEYEHHPDRRTEIPQRVARILADLRRGRVDTLAAAADTRPVHGILFDGLTPPGHPYFAGHYRGEEFRCLRRYEVSIGGRPGWPAAGVPYVMAELARSIAGAMRALDAGHDIPNAVLPPEIKLLHTVQVACRFFERMGWLHPYANGNGHAARFCLWATLARYGYFPVRWPIDPRPPDPPYTQLLLDYRAGNRAPLERYVLQCLA